MATTKSDIAMDKFMEIQELYQMDVENLEDFLDRVTVRLNSLIMWAQETEADRELEMRSDMQEEREEIEDDELQHYPKD